LANVTVELLVFGKGHKTKKVCKNCGAPLKRRSGKNKSGFCKHCHAKQNGYSRQYWQKRKGVLGKE